MFLVNLEAGIHREVSVARSEDVGVLGSSLRGWENP
jgi:hypothetical protein